MSSSLPVGEQQEQELNAVRQQLYTDEQMSWPAVEDEPLNEYQILYLAPVVLYSLLPGGKEYPINHGFLGFFSALF